VISIYKTTSMTTAKIQIHSGDIPGQFDMSITPDILGVFGVKISFSG